MHGCPQGRERAPVVLSRQWTLGPRHSGVFPKAYFLAAGTRTLTGAPGGRSSLPASKRAKLARLGYDAIRSYPYCVYLRGSCPDLRSGAGDGARVLEIPRTHAQGSGKPGERRDRRGWCILPSSWTCLLESSGMIVVVGECVQRQAAEDCLRWRHAPGRIAVRGDSGSHPWLHVRRNADSARSTAAASAWPPPASAESASRLPRALRRTSS